jgi:hypothetical protein
MRRVVILLVTCLFSSAAFGWGEKGHYIVNEAATYGLPSDMPPFFYKAFPELIFLAYDPDRWRGAGESLDAVNPPDHFLDYEYVSHLDLPRDRYQYVALLERSGTLRRYGIENATAGFLPWRIAELSEQLQNEWRQWRSSRPGSAERAFIERDIIHIAGVLGHFAGDASNPHHSTINFNGWVLPNPNGYAIDCDTHARFEKNFVSHAIETKDVTPKVAAPMLRTDYFRTAVDFLKQSNALVEPLYRIDRAGGFALFRKPPSPDAVAFASSRLAAGSSLLRDLWWSTWKNSAKPPVKRAAED